ncbi:MAG: sigma-54-dependent Fis family transcriptional regulator [Candidatus Aminicenantes bacterium]|nr:sigma-54-dependent Fis family transcriptional regulator [Candidatus Aminicenantes bacterium]
MVEKQKIMVPILIAEDDSLLSDSITEFLEDNNYKVYSADNCTDAIKILDKFTINIALIDRKLKNSEGIEILDYIIHQGLKTKMILMTAYGQDHTIKENIRKGTFDFLEKPFKLETLLKRVENAVRMYELEYSDEAAEVYGRSTSIIIGDSDEINTVRKMISMAASTNSPALIQGETGTGKELIARNIHLESDRSRKQFISVNCASIPETLFESEFFGYEKGAFTGAISGKPGLFEIANFGVLHLDEIGEMPVEFQAKLLRALESGTFIKLGGTKEINVDVRIIASTNKNLKEEISKKRFREDLYFRIAVFNIFVPPLRERKEDIPLIAEYLWRDLTIRMGRNNFTPDIDFNALKDREWRGNIRELRNHLENSIIYSEFDAPVFTYPSGIKDGPEPKEQAAGLLIDDIVKAHIIKILNSTGNNKTKTAEMVGMGLSTLKRKLKKWNWDGPDDG